MNRDCVTCLVLLFIRRDRKYASYFVCGVPIDYMGISAEVSQSHATRRVRKRVQASSSCQTLYFFSLVIWLPLNRSEIRWAGIPGNKTIVRTFFTYFHYITIMQFPKCKLQRNAILARIMKNSNNTMRGFLGRIIDDLLHMNYNTTINSARLNSAITKETLLRASASSK